jgi:hypothetical protein
LEFIYFMVWYVFGLTLNPWAFQLRESFMAS